MARFVFFLIVTAAALQAHSVHGQQFTDKRPTNIWNRTGPLGDTPKHVANVYPLSDQQNRGDWGKFEPMSDEFETDQLDLKKWTVGMYWWKGRQPLLAPCHPRS